MSEQRILHIIRSPHVSEKSANVADKHKQFVFKVSNDASKSEIKQAVETMFEVEVDSVKTLNVKPKLKTFGRIPGKRKGWKKAYVCLKAGQDLDFAGGE